MANTEKKREHYEQESLFDFKDYNGGKLSSEDYVKSPINYVGGKFKLLPQIMPLFPSSISTFVDLFSGGANVGINVNADTIIFNDKDWRINEIFRYIQSHTLEQTLNEIYGYIKKYQLSKINREGYTSLCHDYNESTSKAPMMLYVLATYSYNQAFSYNLKGEFNTGFGVNRSYFSKTTREHLVQFKQRLDSINASFIDKPFDQFDFSHLDKQSFIYADPPYLITHAKYNKNWGETEEYKLYSLLDELNQQGKKFALSNVLSHKNRDNGLE